MNCEIDHLISLELGGKNDIKNLWPQPYCDKNAKGCLGAREKDEAENYLHKQICNGKITLIEAQKAIIKDWVKVYKEWKNNK